MDRNRLTLDIDQLSVAGLSPHAREELARAIERELDRLVGTRGLPFGMDLGEIEIGQASLAVAPQPTIAETGVRIARQLLAGLHRRATGRVPPDLAELTG